MIFALLFGCKRLPEAPEDLGELMLFLFDHYEDEDPDTLAQGVDGLTDWVVSLDLEANVNDRAVSLPQLTQLGGLSQPKGTSASAQVPVAVAARSRHGIGEHIELNGETNFVCIDADSTVYARREHLSDHAAYADGSAEFLRTSNEIRRETALLKVWYDLFKDFRRVETEEGELATFSRAWTEEVFPGDKGGNSWDQSFVLDVSLPDPGGKGTLRVYAQWGSVTVGGVGDNIYEGLVKSSIDEGFDNADNFIDGELCKNDRNADYERP